MARMTWDVLDKRYFETGLDRGVLYPKEAPAVPWNGLTGVSEDGGEESAQYHINGRPYLFFPKPKDFSATLTAYTYPDEFAKIMGLSEIEAIEGFYVDSQVGEQFDLSYRTMVGNGVDGIQHGYKIHLVYNAVVAQSAAGYTTLSGSINPIEFSWPIKAVPVDVEGYRPTAHFVIDTRRMDPTHLARIEEILYGDDDTDPSMPDLIDIIEYILYAGAIIITDNGDGTWTAEGPRLKIYKIDDDTFQIEDIDAVINPDGTVELNTTYPT